MKFGYQYGEADAGGEIENRLTFTAGGDFADGRGNAVVQAAYTDQKGLLSRQRANTAIDDTAECALTGEPGTCQNSISPTYSSYSEYGSFFVPSTGQDFTVSEGTGANGTVVPFFDNFDQFGFNRQAFRRYTVPTERYLISSLLDYQMSEGVNTFVEATFAQTRTSSNSSRLRPQRATSGSPASPVDNPFVPQEIRDAVLAAGDDVIQYRRRMTEVGERGATATRNTYRFLVGLEGDVAEKYNWQTYFGYGRMDDAQQGGGQINVLNMREALNVVDDGAGNLVCANPVAVAEGCVPINLFGLGSISPEAADYVRAPTSRQQYTEQQLFGAEFGGSLFACRPATSALRSASSTATRSPRTFRTS